MDSIARITEPGGGWYYRLPSPTRCSKCQGTNFQELRDTDQSNAAGWVCTGCGHVQVSPRRIRAYDTTSVTCPYCGTSGCEADWVDVDVGLIQCGPYLCPNCNASQVGPHDKNPLTEEEKRTGWFSPVHFGTSANTAQGTHVDHKTAKKLYDIGLLDDPDKKEAQAKQTHENNKTTP